MNVTFHVLGGFATAAVLSRKADSKNSLFTTVAKFGVGFVVGVLVHGLLDYLPHEYPLQSKFDITLALILLLFALSAVQKQNIVLLLICFAGSVFPDVIDLGAAIANKHLGVALPQLPFKIFPWHWKQFSGSIYDGSRGFESTVYHLIFVSVCFVLLHVYRTRLFKF